MRRTHLLAAALSATLIAPPLLAQGSAASRQAGRTDPGPAAAPADLLRQAQDALRRNRTAEAQELIERTETRLLTRSTPAFEADQPAQTPVVRQLAAARAAIGSRDRQGALAALDQARAGLREVPVDDSMTGMGSALPPMQGRGSGGMGYSPADIVLAQGGGAGGGGGAGSDSAGSGGLSGSTPGSPGVGNLGSTPQNMLGRSQQPAQGSAVPLAPSRGRGAPDPSAMPGERRTAPGGTAVMPGDPNRR